MDQPLFSSIPAVRAARQGRPDQSKHFGPILMPAMSHSLRHRFCLLVLLTGWLSATAQGPAPKDITEILAPRVRTFARADYGAENQNWDITQSPEGVIYVANSGGVLRFDGLNWTLHQLPARPTVRTVRYAYGRLYVGGYGEFGYFRTEGAELGSYVSLSASLPAIDRGEEIWNIAVPDSAAVYFQSFSRLYRYGEEDVTVETPGDLMFARAAGGSLYLPVTGEGIYRRGPEEPAALLPHSDPGAPVMGVALTSGYLLVATGKKLLRYGPEGYATWSEAADRLLADQQINRLRILADGSVAVGTIRAGVFVFGADGRLECQLSFGNGLSNNTVLSLFEDREGNLWAGLDQGLDLIVRSEPLYFYRSGSRPIGTAYAAARYRGELYVGTNQGLFRYRDAEAAFVLVPGTDGQVWELRPTPLGLLCGHNDGSFLVTGDDARMVSARSGGWQSLFLDGDSTRLLQANYAGLSILNLSTAGEHRLEGLLAPLRYLAGTGERTYLALHGSRGAYRIELTEHETEIARVDTLREPDLVRPILTRFGDTLLVQSEDGVYHYRNGVFDPLAEFRGTRLASGWYALPGRLESGDWFLVEPDRLHYYRGRRRMGTYPIRLRRTFPSLTALADGSYFLCLEEGFAMFWPEITLESISPPGLLLTLTDAPRRKENIQLPFTENDPEFTYALPVLDREVNYRSRLLGFSDEWSEWAPTGHRAYTNLDEGNYRFEVEADWSAAAGSVSFTVRPPWYRTGWAYLGYALLLICLGFVLRNHHRRRLAQQARRLEAIQHRQLQRQRIEARNAQLEAENRRKSRELANTTLTLAKKNEMLLDLKEELSRGAEAPRPSNKLLHLIDRNLNNEEDWAIFESHFNEVHEAFLKRLRQQHSDLTSGDLRLAAYLKMDLSSKEIAPLLHISVRGVENKRYRLRKKLGLEGNDNLNQYLQEF